MATRNICTLGYTKKPLRHFVELLEGASVTKVIDVRLNNTSQLAGFTKKGDLDYILSLVGIEYEHKPELAPTEEMLRQFRDDKNWEGYCQAYLSLLDEREAFRLIRDSFDNHEVVCLLCTEDLPDHCHRRLLAEFTSSRLSGAEIVHLH